MKLGKVIFMVFKILLPIVEMATSEGLLWREIFLSLRSSFPELFPLNLRELGPGVPSVWNLQVQTNSCIRSAFSLLLNAYLLSANPTWYQLGRYSSMTEFPQSLTDSLLVAILFCHKYCLLLFFCMKYELLEGYYFCSCWMTFSSSCCAVGVEKISSW